MQRVKRSTSVAVLPAAPSGGTPGYFANPNPGGGVPATVPGYEWFNSVQEELCAVIAAAGIALDVNNPAQLLAALRSAGVFQTPAQFDNSTKGATTAFIRGALGNYSGHNVVGTTTLTAANAGQVIACAGSATITLPAANAVPGGSAMTFFATGAGVVVQRAGSDTIQPNGATVTSITLNAGDTLVLESNGAAAWGAIGGSAQLGYAGAFGANLAANGYQKLPTGYTEAYGDGGALAAGASVLVTLATTFPTSALVALAGAGVASAADARIGVQIISTSQIRIYNAGTASAVSTPYRVIGK